MTTLYREDFYAWTQQQAKLLQAKEFTEVDWQNLIEEIESMGISERKELTSRLRVLLMHLLKLHYQPRRHPRSWLSTINEQRNQLELLFRTSPSLHREVADEIAYAYPRARKSAAVETGLALSTFPDACPWTVTEILNTDWLPSKGQSR